MEIIRLKGHVTSYKQQIQSFLKNRHCSVAVGNFDGVHIAHQEIITLAKQKAAELGAISAALTFEPHPKLLFNKEPHYLVTDLETKLALLERTKLDLAVIIDFTHEFAALKPEEFIHHVLTDALQAECVVTGYDFCFGSKRAGTTDTLAQAAIHSNFQYHKVQQISYEGMEVSSSHIKKLLNSGLMGLASDLLGRPYTISGNPQTRAGAHPALMLQLNNNLHYPASGMYLCRLRHADKWHYLLGELSVLHNGLQLSNIDAGDASWLDLLTHMMNSQETQPLNVTVEVLQILRPERQMADQAMAQLQRSTDLRDADYVRRMCYTHAGKVSLT